MRVVVRLLAKADISQARAWYEEQRPALGSRFGEALDALVDSLAAHPRIHPRVDEQVRRATLPGFPYGVFYLISGEVVRIIAVSHNARDPARWRTRIK